MESNQTPKDNGIPTNYKPVVGSQRQARAGAQKVGPADQSENVLVSIYVRQAPGTPALPSLDDYAKTPFDQRQVVSRTELAARYGASSDDLKVVTDFAQAAGLIMVQTDAARRLVQVSGTVAQLSKAFAVALSTYRSSAESYRGYEGNLSLPGNVADIVEGVFGLDNRCMARRSEGGVGTVPSGLLPPAVAQAYNFPVSATGATGQTIAILEFSGPPPNDSCGFAQSDIDGFVQNLNQQLGTGDLYKAPTVKTVTIAGSSGNKPYDSATNVTSVDPDVEVALDIEVVVTLAQGANVVVYFTSLTEQGWVDAVTQIAADTVNDPSVLSISYGYAEMVANLSWPEWTQAAFTQVSQAFQVAALVGMTVLVSTGDDGSNCLANDGKAHVNYPASDPGVISCGGTWIHNLSPLSEGTWGYTGGGISYLAPLPSWQSTVKLPLCANNDGRVGRSLPDVAGNASPSSGYDLWLYGKSTGDLVATSGLGAGAAIGPIGGTSAVCPLYAALIARINTLLDRRVGYLNPQLYQLGATAVFRDINDGVSNSALYFTGPDHTGTPLFSPGYKSGAGWDACTGWGVINGTNLLSALSNLLHGAAKVSGVQAAWVTARDVDGTEGVTAVYLKVTWQLSGSAIPASFDLARYTGGYSESKTPDWTQTLLVSQEPTYYQGEYHDLTADQSASTQYRLTANNLAAANSPPVLSNLVAAQPPTKPGGPPPPPHQPIIPTHPG